MNNRTWSEEQSRWGGKGKATPHKDKMASWDRSAQADGFFFHTKILPNQSGARSQGQIDTTHTLAHQSWVGALKSPTTEQFFHPEGDKLLAISSSTLYLAGRTVAMKQGLKGQKMGSLGFQSRTR